MEMSCQSARSTAKYSQRHCSCSKLANCDDRPEAHCQVQVAIHVTPMHAPKYRTAALRPRFGSTLILMWTALEGIALSH